MALHSLPGSAGYRQLHPSLSSMLYAGSADRFAGLLHPFPVFNKGLVVNQRFRGNKLKVDGLYPVNCEEYNKQQLISIQTY